MKKIDFGLLIEQLEKLPTRDWKLEETSDSVLPRKKYRVITYETDDFSVVVRENNVGIGSSVHSAPYLDAFGKQKRGCVDSFARRSRDDELGGKYWAFLDYVENMKHSYDRSEMRDRVNDAIGKLEDKFPGVVRGEEK